MRITNVESTDLFTGTTQRPLQVVRVTVVNDGPGMVRDPATPVTVRADGPGVRTPEPFGIESIRAGEERTVELGVEVAAPYAEGSPRPVTVIAEAGTGGTGGTGGTAEAAARAEIAAQVTAAAPGWTMWMVSHFHYDPVWWNTQGEHTETRLMLPDENGKLPFVRAAFELVHLHLELARQDPHYKFVLAEIDYLKPYFDTHPEDRADLRRFLDEGRIEIVGGNYNEPNTNLTSAESTIRNAIYGIGYQRDVLGGDPASAWMLDVFGHDPGYPSLMAAAGLTSSAWARGPFHQWGPRSTVGDNARMQFPSEFEWISPDGGGLLTAYMPNHYGAGWAMEYLDDLEAAEREAYSQFASLKGVAATRNILLPVGADHVIPSRWSTQIHRDWNARYVWPRFVTAVPREFFAAVRSDAGTRGIAFTPQSRDMNPLYPGKDVSRIDTKQAQRAGETAVMDGERLATLAWLHGARYPGETLDKAWRQLVYGAHHDGITGTNSDQVYLDLLGGWREAYERGDAARKSAGRYLAGLADTSPPAAAGGAAPDRAIVVFNTLAHARDSLATSTLRCAEPGTAWLRLRDGAGAEVPALAEGVRRHPDGTLAEVTLTFRARDVPGLGYRTYWAEPAAAPPGSQGWSPVPGTVIASDAFLAEADPGRGGALSRVRDQRTGAELLHAPGNELVLQDEYDYHPRWNEGPWLIMPKGPGRGSGSVPAQVRAERCPIGSRLVASFELRSGSGTSTASLRVTQETLLWDGAQRVEFRTHVGGSIGHDRLLRVRFPVDVPGGLPIYETSTAVIGRPFGHTDTDVAEHWYTLDNPAYTWFGLGSTARVVLSDGTGGPPPSQAIGVAEVIMPNGGSPVSSALSGAVIRNLVAALARAGVTATCSRADGPRYGAMDLDSNVPDTRIALGGPEVNGFTAEVLAAADPAYAKQLAERAGPGAARLWVPASGPREQAFAPGADVRGARDLPVLVVAAGDLAEAVASLAADLEDAAVDAATLPGPAAAGPGAAGPGAADTAPADTAAQRLSGPAVALLNRGTPGSVVTPDGTLNLSLMRSCSGWPAGVWIDQPPRTVPDGSSFNWQHWSHTFEYALASTAGRAADGRHEGAAADWRDGGGFTGAGQDYNHPLITLEEAVHPGRLPAAGSLMEITAEDSEADGTVDGTVNHAGADGPVDSTVEGTGGAASGAVVLGALKPRGNPQASGRPGPAGAGGSPGSRPIVVRVRESRGRPARIWLRFPGGVTSARVTDLLEERDGGPLVVHDGGAVAEIAPFGTMTSVLTPTVVPGIGTPLAADGAVADGAVPAEPVPGTAPSVSGPGPGEAAEPAQPVFTRYWLHGKGPAPAGNLPATVHLSPTRAVLPATDRAGNGATDRAGAADRAASAGRAVRLQLVVSGGPEPVSGAVRLVLPAGFTAESSRPLRYDLPPGGHASWDLTVRPMPAGAELLPGRYFLAARIGDALGQELEDAAMIAVGEQPLPPLDAPLDQLLPLIGADQDATAAEVEVLPLTTEITLPPGGRGELAVRVANRTRSQIRGEAQLLNPFGSWDLIGPWTQGFTADPGRETVVRHELTAAMDARPGSHWWALVKIMYFGRLRYTDAIPVSIRAADK